MVCEESRNLKLMNEARYLSAGISVILSVTIAQLPTVFQHKATQSLGVAENVNSTDNTFMKSAVSKLTSAKYCSSSERVPLNIFVQVQ